MRACYIFMMGKVKKWLRGDFGCALGIAVYAVAVRMIFLAGAYQHPYFQTPVMDMSYHDACARRIAAGDFWGSEAFFRAPLYLYFLGFLYWLGGQSVAFARFAQSLLGGLTAALCFLTGKEFYGRRVGCLAALVLASLWTAIYYDTDLKLVVLELPLGLAFVYFTALAIRRDSVRAASAAGAALGLNAITRPNVLLVGAFMWLAFLAAGRFARRRLVALLLCLYGVAAVPISAVAARNWVVAKDFVPIAWQGGINLWIGNNPEADGMTAIALGTYGDWWRGYYETIRWAEEAVGRPLKPSEIDRYYYKKALRWACSDPWSFLKLLIRKVYIFTNAYEVANNFDLYYLKKQFPLLKYNPVSLYVVLPFAFFGMAVMAPRWREVAPLYIFVAGYSLSIVAFFVNARFRMPIVPFLVVFAAGAFFYLWDGFRARLWGGREVMGRVALLAVLFLFCDADPFGVGRRSSYESQAHYTMGTIYLERGDLASAEREYRAVLAGPGGRDIVNAYNDLGIIAARRGDFTHAERYFSAAVKLDPRYSKGWNNLGNLALARGDLKGARRYYEISLARDGEDARAYYFYGKLLLREGNAAAAEEELKRAVYFQPNFSEAWFELGRLAFNRREWSRARFRFGRAAYHSPASFTARMALAGSCLKMGDYAAAEREYRRALEIYESANARYNLACALARQGRVDEAMVHLRRALTMDGARYGPRARIDEDLAVLRGREDFSKLIGAIIK